MKIEYFAWLKDTIGLGEEEISIHANVTDVGKLINWLSTRSPRYAEAFEFAEVIKVVVNRENVGNDHPVKQDDEVIFIPPIAGG